MRLLTPSYPWVVIPAFIVALASCGSAGENRQITKDTTIATPIVTDTPSLDNTIDADTTEYATVHIVIADTGQNYYLLREEMLNLATTLKWQIDTMGRYYNKKKKEIVLPDDDSDEIYRGEYFPRRFTSETLSLEYYKSYNDSSTVKNIALVAAICESEQRADSLLNTVKPQAAHAFVYRTKIYTGCIH